MTKRSKGLSGKLYLSLYSDGTLRALFLVLLLFSCGEPSSSRNPEDLIPIPLRWEGKRNPLEVEFCKRWEEKKGVFQFPETYRSPCLPLDRFLSPYSSLLLPLDLEEELTGGKVITAEGEELPVEFHPFLSRDRKRWVEIFPVRPYPPGRNLLFCLYGRWKPRPWGRCLGGCPQNPPACNLLFSAEVTDPVSGFWDLLLHNLTPSQPIGWRPLNIPFPEGKAFLVDFRFLDYRLPDDEGGTIALENPHPVTAPVWVLLPRTGAPRGYLIFLHGLGGNPSMFLPFYRKVVLRGYGALGPYQLRHPPRSDVKGVGFQVDIVNSYLNLANLQMMRDNFRQMILEIRELILALPALNATFGFSPPPTLSVGYVGESLGCLVGGGAFGLIPEIERAACLVGGSRLYRLFTDSPAGMLFGSLEIPLGGLFYGKEWDPFLRAIGPRSLDGGDPGVLGALGISRFPGRFFRLYLAHQEALMPNNASMDMILALKLPRLGSAPSPWDSIPQGDPRGSGFRVGVYPEKSPPDRHGAVKDDPVFQDEIVHFLLGEE